MTRPKLTERDFVGFDADNDRVYKDPTTGRLFCGRAADRLDRTPPQGYDPEEYLAEYGPLTWEPK